MPYIRATLTITNAMCLKVNTELCQKVNLFFILFFPSVNMPHAANSMLLLQVSAYLYTYVCMYRGVWTHRAGVVRKKYQSEIQIKDLVQTCFCCLAVQCEKGFNSKINVLSRKGLRKHN